MNATAQAIAPNTFLCGHKREAGNIRRVGNNALVCRTCTKPDASSYKVKCGTFRKKGIPFFCAACETGRRDHGRHPCLVPVRPVPEDFVCKCGTAWPVRWLTEIAAEVLH